MTTIDRTKRPNNYFKPVVIRLRPDEEEIEQLRKEKMILRQKVSKKKKSTTSRSRSRSRSKSRGSSKSRKKKDPNEPKRVRSAFIFYSMDKRKQLKKKYPNLKNTEITKKIGKAWHKESDKVIGKYERKREEDKVRYEKEMKDYKRKQKRRKQSSSESNSETSSAPLSFSSESS
eukprot:TRINITY_DN11108_c0_g1_i1.p1 TRINITY_DN11108_c0_g1~~TRINITY_DN11108_c0_g1_i1.p1  ORF type:complete len:174 (-),score=49.85 TRINITY_DN11108_c0_g1_i1:24-545(-)